MRVALIVPGGVDRSGRDRVIPVILWLMERLARSHQVTVIALSQYPQPCEYELLGTQVFNLGTPRLKMPGGWIPQRLHQLDTVAQRVGGFDVVHGFWAGQTGWLAGAWGKWRHVPAVVSLCGGELVALPDVGYGSQLTRNGRMLVGQVLQMANHLTVQSRTMQDYVAMRGYYAEHVPTGVAEQWVGPHKKESGQPFRLLHVGSLNRIKDQTTLLRAMAEVIQQIPSVHLDIIGEDTLAGELQRLAESLGIQRNVTFCGFMPNDAVQAYYRQADLFLLTSRHESGPIAVLEAAAMGVPTVGTRVGHIADWEGKEALAVSVADAEALAQGILALQGDAARRRTMGQAAQAWASHYSAEWTAARFTDIYERLVSPAAQGG